MLARAIVSRPRLLLLDGILDALSDDELSLITPQLCGDTAPWTLAIATGKRWIADQCDTQLSLPEGVMKTTIRGSAATPTTQPRIKR